MYNSFIIQTGGRKLQRQSFVLRAHAAIFPCTGMGNSGTQTPVPQTGSRMKGPSPKPPGLRQRRNRASTKATLPTEAEAAKREIPPLPVSLLGGKAKWHPQVLEWWQDIWQSPMAAEFVQADRQGLYRLARLNQDFWRARSAKARSQISAAVCRDEARFGLTPGDRRRLPWAIEKGETAAMRTETRRKRKRPNSKHDPRDVLRLEK